MRNDEQDDRVLPVIRSFLLGIIALVLTGLLAELLFLNHLKTPLQMLPAGLAAGGLVVIVRYWISPNATSLRILKGILIACTVVGVLGIVIHAGILSSMRDRKARGRRPEFTEEPPPLAPMVMVPIGLLGLAFTFRHPDLEERIGHNFQSITMR